MARGRKRPWWDGSADTTCGNAAGARSSCRDPECWCSLEKGAQWWADLDAAWHQWPRMGADIRFELLRRGYAERPIVEVQLPD